MTIICESENHMTRRKMIPSSAFLFKNPKRLLQRRRLMADAGEVDRGQEQSHQHFKGEVEKLRCAQRVRHVGPSSRIFICSLLLGTDGQEFICSRAPPGPPGPPAESREHGREADRKLIFWNRHNGLEQGVSCEQRKQAQRHNISNRRRES